MKTRKVFMLVIFFSILIFISLSAFATNSNEKEASDFQSNGDLIEGWYWLRDSAHQDYVEWTFDNIPLGPEELTVQINALATDRPSGGSGFDAKFLLYYSPIGEGPIPTMLIPPQTVILKNVSSPDDSLGYNCQGQITIPASSYPGASRISLKIKRDSEQDNHIAFREESMVLLTDATNPPYVDPSTNDDDFEGAVPIQPGIYTDSLGEEDAEGHRDKVDYYSIDLVEGQLITLKLTMPENASYGISLLSPNHGSRGSSITQREIKTLDYVADSTDTWYIRIRRSSGEGEYQLSIDIQDQNDADSGHDAGKSTQKAIPVSPGVITGFLKVGDNKDFYSIDLVEGQLITLKLTMPENANYRMGLSFTKKLDGGSIDRDEQGNIKILKVVVGKPGTGTWYINVYRSSGEGYYQLSIDTMALSNQGRTLTSSIPIFVEEDEVDDIEIDSDGDGIVQEWEDKAMEYVNPNFELDEDEDWLTHPEHHVVNFVRIFPYPSKNNRQYLLFTYCVTWSRDYGRAGFAGHNGDVERVIMAWKITDPEEKNLQLKKVFTSAHGGDNDHSAVWDARDRSCFTCGIDNWPVDEEMCGKLVFEENILKLQVSEDKHAIYPTVSCCEGVTLTYAVAGFVMEDCGGGVTKQFECYNAGEPGNHLIDDLDDPSSWKGLSESKRNSLINLFPNEQVWSGNKNHPDKFCGALGCSEESMKGLVSLNSPGRIGDKLKDEDIPKDLIKN